MLIPVESLIDGVVRTLTGEVAPDVATPFARGQLYAAVDVLRNLRDRVEEMAAPRAIESDAIRRALADAAAALRAAGAGDEAGAIEARLGEAESPAPVPTPAARADAAPPGGDPGRLVALRAALGAALETIDALTPDRGREARAILARHLGTQAMRDVEPLKPSMLGEISGG